MVVCCQCTDLSFCCSCEGDSLKVLIRDYETFLGRFYLELQQYSWVHRPHIQKQEIASIVFFLILLKILKYQQLLKLCLEMKFIEPLVQIASSAHMSLARYRYLLSKNISINIAKASQLARNHPVNKLLFQFFTLPNDPL